MPCILGSDHDFCKGDETRKSLNISLTSLQEDLYPEIKEQKISYRLAVTGCSGVYFLFINNPFHRGKCHAILRYSKEREEYEIKALYPLYVNRVRKEFRDGYTPLHGFDCIYFDCARCPVSPHVYHFTLPSLPKERTFLSHTGGKGADASLRGKSGEKVSAGMSQALATKWTVNEREQLKKVLMIYGYGRWEKIRKNSPEIDGTLKKKSDIELKAYSVAFIKSILEYLSFEKTELKKYLAYVIEDQKQDDLYVPSKPSILMLTTNIRGMGRIAEAESCTLGKKNSIVA